MLEIKDLCVSIDGKEILTGVDLSVGEGEIHAIMGPNGAGKSTLVKVLGGHPDYEIERGEILFKGSSLLELEPSERARLGLFMSFQYPIEISGVSNFDFLKAAYQAHHREISDDDFRPLVLEKSEQLKIDPSFLSRDVNEGFSGGEKKRNEILQMAVLDPHLALLDETDSGLDIDALRVVAEGIKQAMRPDRSLLLITHYQRLLNYVKPDYVHVMARGKICQTGGPELALKLEEKGYDWIAA